MDFNLVNLQPYANPQYFIYLIIGLIPLMIGLWFGKRFKTYEAIFSLVFLFLIFDCDKWQQGINLLLWLGFEFALTMFYQVYRSKKNKTSVFYLMVILAILPLAFVKYYTSFPISSINFTVGFLGISYVTFKTVQIIMEMRDGAIKKVEPATYLRFLLFFPTISSGPIDRYRRFKKDYDNAPSRDEYVDMITKGIHYLFLGLFYKFILGWLFGTVWLPVISQKALAATTTVFGIKFSWWLVAYMYDYSMYLFFDFAGYSLFAVSISYFMGIKTPMNFNKPFISKNIKDFWNRWHMTLSFWFRDYIYMRFTFFAMKKKWFKKRIRMAQVSYFLLFLIMGVWHGLTWYYIVYGIFHATAICINDAWLRFKIKHKKQIPSNTFTKWFAIFLTFNTICFSLLIFSGFIDTFWFK